MQLRRALSYQAARKWFMWALLLLVLFGIFTAILATGILLYPTLYVERWLLHRPLTAVDCMFFEWKQLGEVGFSLFFMLVLATTCLLLGYRRRIFLYLFLLLLLGVGAEYVGKNQFPQIIPANTQFGINSLACPQIWQQPRTVKLEVALGMWWQAPPVRARRLENEQYSASAPFIFDDNATIAFGYPSGHTLRWDFLGLVACWLCWRHVKRRILRVLLMAIALVVAFGGGFAQFYIGQHLSTDLVGGYLLGTSLACCAIGLLCINYAGRSHNHTVTPAAQQMQPSTIGKM